MKTSLRLNRETLRSLQDETAAQVLGGTAVSSECSRMVSDCDTTSVDRSVTRVGGNPTAVNCS